MQEQQAGLNGVRIDTSFSGATFIQLWRMRSARDQQAWFETMHRKIHLLQRQPGFRSMSLHQSTDGCNVVVYAQWESEGDLTTAAGLPEVKAARDELDRWGEPDGTVFAVASMHFPKDPAGTAMQIESGFQRLTFVNFWSVDGREAQEKLLSAMRESLGNLLVRLGLLGLAMHASADGKRVVVYTQWESLAGFEAAITNDASASEERDKLAQIGQPAANTYRVESVHLPLGEAMPSEKSLLERCSVAWASRGFTTRVVRANGAGLHVAEAGTGEAVVLLHGYPQSGEAWRMVAPTLAKTHRVIVPDLRGMGLSEAAPEGYDLSNVAEDVHQLVLAMGIKRVKVVGHDWGAAVGAVYALRYREEVVRLAFLESALAGAGFEDLWSFSKANDTFTFIPFLLMGGRSSGEDTTAALLKGREAIFLQHLWATFTGDKKTAPFESWAPYVAYLARAGVASASSSYYRAIYASADQVRALLTKKLEIPVLAMAGEKGIGADHEGLVRAFASNVVSNVIIPGAGHFLAEERPAEVSQCLASFLRGFAVSASSS